MIAPEGRRRKYSPSISGLDLLRMTMCALHCALLIAPLSLPPSLTSRAIDLLTHELTRRSQALSLLEEEVTAKDAETKAEQGRRAEAEREIEGGCAQVGHCNACC